MEAKALVILFPMHFFALSHGWLFRDGFIFLYVCIVCIYVFSAFFVVYLDYALVG